MNRPDAHNASSDDSPFEMSPVVPEGAMSAGSGDRPRNLSVICILAIVLAGTGLLTGCFGLMSQVFASQAQQALSAIPGAANQPGADMQRKMNERLMAVTNKYKWVVIPLMVAKIAIEGLLLAGAVMTLGLKPRGRSVFLAGLIGAMIVEPLQVVPGLMIQSETMAVMREMLPQPGQNAPAPGVNDFISTFVAAISIFSMAAILVWLTIKFVYYVIALRYLRKPEVAALFAVPPA